jgi:hypothetical protein
VTTLAHLHGTALALPETTSAVTDAGVVTFTVRDKRFAAAGKDGCVELHLPSADADEVLAAHPTASRLSRAAGVRVPLADLNGQQLNHWVRRAWLSRAPKALAAQARAADNAVPGEVGDLPRSIGRPATQALVNAGITTLAQVAALTDAELKAMHGVGPKAIQILRATHP